MLLDFAQASLIGKARQQPERVRELVDKIKADGVGPTVESVRARLDEPIALGYANAGTVVAVGPGVTAFRVGDLVATNGPHAEFVSVPATLCVLVPPGIAPEHAAFATLGAVALEGLRLAAPQLGERFVVTGLGLVGLLAVQLLRAQGCAVLGIDINTRRLELAEHFGAVPVRADNNTVRAADAFSKGRGVDGVLIAASTKSNDPVHDAALMCRRRGRIVLVGVTGLELQRNDFYDKELSLQVSCSYGPGRYDVAYEDRAHDYPLGYVRWTAGRNMEAVVDMIETRRLDIGALITHRYSIEQAQEAYDTLTTDTRAIGIVLTYKAEAADDATLLQRTIEVSAQTNVAGPSRGVGIIGAGQFASRVVLPALKSAGVRPEAIAGSRGSSASLAARRFGIARATSDAEGLIDAPDIDVVFVLTRHDSHAPLVERALDAGKHVFVEKPLAIDTAGLEAVIAARERCSQRGQPVPVVGVGFNRRFAPITRRMIQLLSSSSGPRAVNIVVNAGAIKPDHWTQDPLVGGGRIAGEACHFVDLARHLTGSAIINVHSEFLAGSSTADTASITLTHADGSVSSINYFANGARRFPKERVTVFADGRVLINDNFRRLHTYGLPRLRPSWSRTQDKGHVGGITAFLDATRGERPAPIPFDEIVEVTAATLLAARLV